MARPKKESSDSENQIPSTIQSLIDSGIPLKRVVLHGPVIFLPDGMPETAFYDDPEAKTKPIPGRQAKIWYTPSALLIEQRGRYKILHPVQIKDSDVQL